MKPAHLRDELAAWLPPEVLLRLREAGETAAELGYSLYLIGGGVRDLLLNRPFDWDVDLVSETYGVEKLAAALQQRWGGSLQAFARYGTAKLRLEPLDLDFATARTEHYAYPGANPEVSFSSLEADLIRRDFTINALAVGLLPHQFGALIDPHQGWEDLQSRCLRALHERKFVEDPVRCWRAARMARMLDFELESATRGWLLEAMQTGGFDRFFSARMRRELGKVLAKPDPLPYLRELHQLQVLRCLDPDLDWPRFEAFAIALPRWQALFDEADRESVYLLGLLSAIQTRDLPGLELTRPQILAWQQLEGLTDVDWAQLEPSRAWQRLQPLAPEALWALMAAVPASIDTVTAYWTTWRFIKPAVSGTIIKEWIPPGPHIRRILQTILFARLDGLIETPEQELALARQLADEVGE